MHSKRGNRESAGRDAGERRSLALFLAVGLMTVGIPALAEERPAASPQQAAAPSITLSAEKRQLIGVRTAVASLHALDRQIRTVGKVEVDETSLSFVNTKVAGWVKKLFVDYTGKEVVKGQPLFSIYSPDLVTAQEEYLLALKARASRPGGAAETGDASENLVASAKRRLLLWDISEQQIADLEKAGKPQTEITLLAPQNGIVMEKMVLDGTYVTPGMNAYKIADLSSVWVVADIYEYEVPLVKLGQQARVTLPYASGSAIAATVSYINPSLDPMSRTVKVRLSMKNPGLLLKPEMFANVEIVVGGGKRLAIPSEAVLDSGLRQVVYVEKKPGTYEMRQVKLGSRGDKFVEVLSGLKAGEKVVTSGNFLIDSETQLRTGQ
jgi:membrane fusion protein, copper/silver efflux system